MLGLVTDQNSVEIYTNLKIYNTKVNSSACKITFLLSSAVSTLIACFKTNIYSKFFRFLTTAEKRVYKDRNWDCKSVYYYKITPLTVQSPLQSTVWLSHKITKYLKIHIFLITHLPKGAGISKLMPHEKSDTTFWIAVSCSVTNIFHFFILRGKSYKWSPIIWLECTNFWFCGQ